ncbi:MAG: septum formation initiator family protein [Rubrivivax sp.]|jgi:cell division protein FtsB|nr:septum formation initiator family protein [Rubrivivax sp.]
MLLRAVNLTLLALLLLVHADLWLGKSGQPYVWTLERQVADQRAANDAARLRNERLHAEVSDLKEGLEMVEEKARSELNMLRPDEILVQIRRR